MLAILFHHVPPAITFSRGPVRLEFCPRKKTLVRGQGFLLHGSRLIRSVRAEKLWNTIGEAESLGRIDHAT